MSRCAMASALVLLVALPLRAADPADALAARIDALLAVRLRTVNVAPAALAGDAEFLRRTYLDLAGRIPTRAEAVAFLADPLPNKRRRLVARLLKDPRY